MIYTLASSDLEMLIFGGLFSYDMSKWLYTYSQEIAKNLISLYFYVLEFRKLTKWKGVLYLSLANEKLSIFSRL